MPQDFYKRPAAPTTKSIPPGAQWPTQVPIRAFWTMIAAPLAPLTATLAGTAFTWSRFSVGWRRQKPYPEVAQNGLSKMQTFGLSKVQKRVCSCAPLGQRLQRRRKTRASGGAVGTVSQRYPRADLHGP